MSSANPQTSYLPRSARYYRANKALQPWLYNLALIFICIFMLAPVAGTLITSTKGQNDVQRNPPVLLPCDTPASRFDVRACRFSLEGYLRILDPKPNTQAPLGIELTGRMFSIYLPNTLLYA